MKRDWVAYFIIGRPCLILDQTTEEAAETVKEILKSTERRMWDKTLPVMTSDECYEQIKPVLNCS